MKAYRTYFTVTDSKQVVLTDVPFQPGQRLEVLLLTTNEAGSAETNELQALLKATQALPHVQSLTDDEIAAEVAAYRNGQ